MKEANEILRGSIMTGDEIGGYTYDELVYLKVLGGKMLDQIDEITYNAMYELYNTSTNSIEEDRYIIEVNIDIIDAVIRDFEKFDVVYVTSEDGKESSPLFIHMN
jgi:hypothetical protein